MGTLKAKSPVIGSDLPQPTNPNWVQKMDPDRGVRYAKRLLEALQQKTQLDQRIESTKRHFDAQLACFDAANAPEEKPPLMTLSQDTLQALPILRSLILELLTNQKFDIFLEFFDHAPPQYRFYEGAGLGEARPIEDPSALLMELSTIIYPDVPAHQLSTSVDCGGTIILHELTHKVRILVQATPVNPAGLAIIVRCAQSPILSPKEQLECTQYYERRMQMYESMKQARTDMCTQICTSLNQDMEKNAAATHTGAAYLGALVRAIEKGSLRAFTKAVKGLQGLQSFEGMLFYVRSSGVYFDTILHLAVAHNRTQMIGPLLELGANPDLVNSLGETPLHFAIRQNNMSAFEALLPHSLMEAEDFEGHTPLMNAARLERTPMLLALCGHCTEEQINSAQGERFVHNRHLCLSQASTEPFEPAHTALFFAASEGYVEGSLVLLRFGADPRIGGSSNAIERAKAYGHDRCFALLTERAHTKSEYEELERQIMNTNGSDKTLQKRI